MKNHSSTICRYVYELSPYHSYHMPVWSDTLVIFIRPQAKYKFQVAIVLHFITNLPQQKLHNV